MKHARMMWFAVSMIALAPAASASEIVVAAAGSRPDTALVRIGPEETGTRAFVAWPAGKKPAQAVIVVHEWWGLNEQIRSVARRVAGQGYVAIVPDLYHGKVASDAESAHELTRSVEEEQVLADFDATIEWLRHQPRTQAANIGAMGFCMGGRFAQILGMTGRDVSAIVVFYGRPVDDEERIEALSAPLQGHYGVDDRGIPLERVTAFEKALDHADKDATIYTYPGAGHAFMHEPRKSYRSDAARQAWARTLSFFHKHLKK